jgi:hypothetical protein
MNTRISKAKAIAAIEAQIEALPVNEIRGDDSPAFKRWHSSTEATLRNIFGNESRQLDKFQGISFMSMLLDNPADHERYRSGMETARAYLTANIEEIEEFWPDSNEPPVRGPVYPVTNQKWFNPR